MQDVKPPMPPSPLAENPGLWRGRDLQDREDWIFRFPPRALAEIRAALSSVGAKGLKAPDFGKADFPLPQFASVLEGMLEELETGRGFFLMRGFPAAEFSE